MRLETKTTRLKATSVALFALMATGLGSGIPAAALADEPAAGLQFIIVSDDLRKTTTETERAEGSTAPAAAPAAGGSADGAADGSADGTGKTNNGHGNNVDGVDSSNPGQGQGGPNADGMDFDPNVDDEANTGSGSSSSSSPGNSGNNKNKNKNK